MIRSEIRYQIYRRLADPNLTFEHCEQGQRLRGISAVQGNSVLPELLPVWQAVGAAIDRELDWD